MDAIGGVWRFSARRGLSKAPASASCSLQLFIFHWGYDAKGIVSGSRILEFQRSVWLLWSSFDLLLALLLLRAIGCGSEWS